MQQIIDFIFRKKDVVVYFILLFFSIILTLNSNYFHKSKIILLANNISNFTTERFILFYDFFDLKQSLHLFLHLNLLHNLNLI